MVAIDSSMLRNTQFVCMLLHSPPSLSGYLPCSTSPCLGSAAASRICRRYKGSQYSSALGDGDRQDITINALSNSTTLKLAAVDEDRRRYSNVQYLSRLERIKPFSAVHNAVYQPRSWCYAADYSKLSCQRSLGRGAQYRHFSISATTFDKGTIHNIM